MSRTILQHLETCQETYTGITMSIIGEKDCLIWLQTEPYCKEQHASKRQKESLLKTSQKSLQERLKDLIYSCVKIVLYIRFI